MLQQPISSPMNKTNIYQWVECIMCIEIKRDGNNPPHRSRSIDRGKLPTPVGILLSPAGIWPLSQRFYLDDFPGRQHPLQIGAFLKSGPKIHPLLRPVPTSNQGASVLLPYLLKETPQKKPLKRSHLLDRKRVAAIVPATQLGRSCHPALSLLRTDFVHVRSH